MGILALNRELMTLIMIKAPKPKDSKMWRDSYYHKLFGFKAAKEAARVLKFFEKERPEDMRPREAIEAIREWSEDKRTLGMKEVRKLSLNAHAAPGMQNPMLQNMLPMLPDKLLRPGMCLLMPWALLATRAELSVQE